METEKKRPFYLGIYGGTFDPPHNGHVRAATAFLERMQLDALYVMPSAIPPHKRITTGSAPEIRLALSHAAFDGISQRLTVSDFEIQSAEVSYTYKTLLHFQQTTDARLFFLCGGDMFCSIDMWRCPEIIFSLATVVCALREDTPQAVRDFETASRRYREKYGANTVLLENVPLELSSSNVRQMMENGEDISPLVPEKVARMIRTHCLYKGEQDDTVQ